MKGVAVRPWLATVVVLAGLSAPAAAEPLPSSQVEASDEWEIGVFLCTPAEYGCGKRYATEKQKRALRTFLESRSELAGIRFVDRATAHREFRLDFGADKALMRKYPAKKLPESFWLRVKKGADRGAIFKAVARRPEVGFVQDHAEVYGAPQTSVPDISVFLCTKGSAMPTCVSGRGAANEKEITPKERKTVVAAIESTPGMESYVYEDQATAYRNFSESFADNEDLLNATRLSDMPTSYRVKMRPEVDWEAASRRWERLRGVAQVFNQRCFDASQRLVADYGLSIWTYQGDVCACGLRAR